ncbi:MAG: DUF998 domain-containing protein [Candidatus Bathyarchaeia archaeon]
MKKYNAKLAGTLIFAGAVQFIICMLIAECIYPGYSVSENYISDLGVGVSAPIFNASVFVLGLTVVASAYFLKQIVKSKIFLSFLVLCGIGAIGVGVFPENFGAVHFAVSLIAFLFGALSAIASFRFQKAPLSHFAAVLGLISLAALMLFGLKMYLGLGKGGMERMIAYPMLLWAIGFGGHLLKE